MKCPKCGADVIGTEKFCNACGNEISQPTTESTPQVVDSIQTETAVNQVVSPVSEPTVIQPMEMASEPVAPVAPVIPEPVVSQPTEVVSQPVEPMAAPVTPEVVNTPVEPMVQPVAEPVAQPVVEPTVVSEPVVTESVSQPNVGEVPVGSSQPVETVAPVSEPTVNQPMASEPTQPEVSPASMEAPVTTDAPSSAPSDGEPPKKKSSKGLLIVVIVILIAALGVGGYYVYNQYFVEDGDSQTNGGEDVDSDPSVTPTNDSLICNRMGERLNSVVDLDYIEGELVTYNVSYNANTYGMEAEEANAVIDEYNQIVMTVTALENETGFNLYMSESTDEETGAVTMNINYTINVQAATSPEVLALIGDPEMTIQEQTTALEAQDYTCS